MLACFKGFTKKSKKLNDNNVSDVTRYSTSSSNLQLNKKSMDTTELLEPVPIGYENNVRIDPAVENEFLDPRGQIAMQTSKLK
ncbi:MAG TPA: hypothetical protein VGK47_03145 [Nitrososphaeraceae archaeon]